MHLSPLGYIIKNSFARVPSGYREDKYTCPLCGKPHSNKHYFALPPLGTEETSALVPSGVGSTELKITLHLSPLGTALKKHEFITLLSMVSKSNTIQFGFAKNYRIYCGRGAGFFIKK